MERVNIGNEIETAVKAAGNLQYGGFEEVPRNMLADIADRAKTAPQAAAFDTRDLGTENQDFPG